MDPNVSRYCHIQFIFLSQEYFKFRRKYMLALISTDSLFLSKHPDDLNLFLEIMKMIRNALTICAFTVTMGCSNAVITDPNNDQGKNTGHFNFKPLTESANSANWNPAAPWKLPEGFTQTVVVNESSLNIYDAGRNDWNDMNTVNETGLHAGRYMYRTHEVRGGAVSVIDLKTGETKILVQDTNWTALDGIRWTPWGSLIFSEETTGGRLMEVILDPNNPMKALEVIDRPAVGRVAHEGLEVDNDGNVYVVDEHRGRTQGCAGITPCGGGIYKFIPDTYGDLSSGSLYVLSIKATTRRNNTGQAEWLGPIDASHGRKSGTDFGGTSYQRPEDLQIINGILYVAVTEGSRDEYGKEYYEGRVISVDLNTLQVADFVKPGVNVPHEIGKPGEAGHQTGFDGVDNLAESPDGRLVMIEDNIPSDIWFASTKTNKLGASKEVKLFGSLTDPEAEGTGIYFSPKDPKTLYVNVQHSVAEDGDATWAITRNHD